MLNVKHIVRFSPQDVIKVDAVLGMITPIGVQMEYDRERVSVFYFRYTSYVGVTHVTLALLEDCHARCRPRAVSFVRSSVGKKATSERS